MKGPALTVHRVGEVISAIGQAAGVKVNTDPKTGKVKYASAHDFRRAFGERWAAFVMPALLKDLMRHAEIPTTMKYYVGRNAQTPAAALYAAVRSNCSSNRAAESSSAHDEAPTQTSAASGLSEVAEEGFDSRPESAGKTGGRRSSGAFSGAVDAETGPSDPRLSTIAQAWPHLPESVRRSWFATASDCLIDAATSASPALPAPELEERP